MSYVLRVGLCVVCVFTAYGVFCSCMCVEVLCLVSRVMCVLCGAVCVVCVVCVLCCVCCVL